MSTTRIQYVLLAFLIYSSGIGQDALAMIDTSDDVQGVIDKHMIVIDTDLESSRYPSMEEEMRMYIELTKDAPLAFFFPNPSKGIVWIEHNLGPSCEVRLIDKDGHIIFTAKDMKTKKLDLTNFPKGEYDIELVSGSSKVSKSLKVN